MKKIKPYLVIAVVAIVTIAIVFRIGKARTLVTGQA
jgi:hypothetical protein